VRRRLADLADPADSAPSLGDLITGLAARLKGLDTEAFVDRAYELILRREPDADGRSYFVRKIESGDFTPMNAIAEMLVSDELRSQAASEA